ncbi:bifunctional 2-C-methyl-D-erythritol 4-phosphate cytidylyltransferase/2-C-methyl-D-erythritol 2,4-cyclodiphosphate synthase [Aquamicrobium sp. LC103]|nr:bifunctional 2-C-methyl-D-erythritol 4-phosphate cytidylyltransferase/2-C-methyl-D-erythritol 2,4-cyclodiphosphate synthase [Aquamicrobium sp. LC103]
MKSRRRTVMKNGKIGVVLVAAGRGERAGQSIEGPKQYRLLGSEPVIRHTLRAFLGHPAIASVAVAIHPQDEDLFSSAAGEFASKVIVVYGGATRQASTRLALLALRDEELDAVLIHDAVRPFVEAALIDRVVEGVEPERGSLPALPVSDTLKRAGEAKLVTETVPRAGLYAAQTPQGFPFAPILEAHERAHAAGRQDFTDDAAIAEWAGIPVRIVEGAADNVKLTWARDIEIAKARMITQTAFFPDVRTGNGYDVHSFEEGSHVTLCGVEIPHDKRLSGHSDADVGLHALTDALLATCGAGDIGTHFPPSDMRWKGAASKIFVAEAVRIVRERGGRIANADVTLICEAPRIGPHREAMTAALCGMLGISADRVSVKATTNEKLGFVGRKEGIAAIATATVVYPGGLPE